MRLALRSSGTAAALAVALSGCETKVTQISVVCRPGDQPTAPRRHRRLRSIAGQNRARGGRRAGVLCRGGWRHFGGLLSPPTCGRYTDGHLDIGKAADVPNLKDKHPLNLRTTDGLEVSSLPTAVPRTEGPEASTYAFFQEPIAMTETKNATSVPDDVAKQAAEVGVTATTPTFAITGEPAPTAGTPPTPPQAGKT
jgi:hypothetical protein